MRLELKGVHATYGLAPVLRGVDLVVEDGACMVLLGRNGMGKSSTLRCIMGMDQPAVTQGEITLGESPVTGVPSHRIVQQGVGYVPQGRRIFKSLSVQENLQLPAAQPTNGAGKRWTLDTVYGLFPILGDRTRQLGGTLSGGEQQMLAVARALMTNPSLLLLDEPSEGLAPMIVQELLQTLVSLRDTGMTILLAEQNFSVAESMADRVALMERGEVALVDSLDAVADDETVKRRYLGVG
jgi:branched-chain amino acid transport system ATP-binding protein